MEEYFAVCAMHLKNTDNVTDSQVHFVLLNFLDTFDT